VIGPPLDEAIFLGPFGGDLVNAFDFDIAVALIFRVNLLLH